MLRQAPGFPNQWKTSLNFDALWDKPLNSEFDLTGKVETDYFQDKQVSAPPPFFLSGEFPGSYTIEPTVSGLSTGLDNKIYRQSAQIGLNIHKYHSATIVPSVGIYGESVMESPAVGPTANLEIDWNNLQIEGFNTSLSAVGSGQFLDTRNHREIEVNLNAEREFTEYSSNKFSANYRNYSREFPVSSAQNDRRREDEYLISNQLDYQISTPISLDFDLNLSRRMVEPTLFVQSNKLEELSTGLYSGLRGEFGEHNFRLGFSSIGQNQSYPVRTVDGRQYSIESDAGLKFKSDSLNITMILSRYKYDVSPDEYSIDTRDELRHSYILNHTHIFDKSLNLNTLLRVDLHHMVYLESERSGDNNWDRFFLLSPAVSYKSEDWSQLARFKVSADYLDYDFAESEASNRVFRKFSLEDSLHVRLQNNLSVQIQYLLLLEDQGDLDWGAFIEELSDEYRTHDGSVNFIWKERTIEYRVGWGYYRRRAFHANSYGEMERGELVESTGPLLGVYGRGPVETEIELTVSYKWVSSSYMEQYSLTNIDLTLLKSF